jgi:hypothetical protein
VQALERRTGHLLRGNYAGRHCKDTTSEPILERLRRLNLVARTPRVPSRGFALSHGSRWRETKSTARADFDVERAKVDWPGFVGYDQEELPLFILEQEVLRESPGHIPAKSTTLFDRVQGTERDAKLSRLARES